MEGNEPLPFDWSLLVPLLVHPVKVGIIESLRWIGEPLSASELKNLFAEEPNTSYISYHVVELAKAGAIVKVSERPVRGAVKKSYFFPSPE